MGADVAGDIALAVGVLSPTGDRAVLKDGDGVTVTRGDTRDGILRGADAAWDIALAVVVVSLAGDRAIGEQRDGVIWPAGDLDGVLGGESGSGGVVVHDRLSLLVIFVALI